MSNTNVLQKKLRGLRGIKQGISIISNTQPATEVNEKPEKEELLEQLLQQQREEFYPFLCKKVEKNPKNKFLHDMLDRILQAKPLTENMINVLRKIMAEEERKIMAEKEKLVEIESLPKITFRMKQWWCKQNNINSRVITGKIIRETSKAYYIKGHADIVESTICARCGQELTQPASYSIGLGPICAGKWGVPYPEELNSMTKKEEQEYRRKIRKVLEQHQFEVWVPKSQIVEIIAKA